MTRLIVRRQLLIVSLLTLLCGPRPSACGQQGAPPSTAESIAKARLFIVRRFGTPTQADAYQHPGKPPAGLKQPKFPAHPKGPEDLAAFMDYRSYSMRPSEIYDMVYENAVFETYGLGLMQRINAVHPEDDKAFKTIFAATTHIPMQAEVWILVMSSEMAAFNRESKRVAVMQEKREALYIGAARVAGVAGVMGRTLTKEALEEYAGGSLATKVRLLFQAAQASLKRQPEVAAYVIRLSDLFLPQASGSRADDPLDFSRIFPEDPRLQVAALQQMSEPERCQVLTSALSRLIEQGKTSMLDTNQREAFLKPFLTGAPADAASFVLASTGPETAERYEAASPEERRDLLRYALAFRIGSEMVFRLNVGDEHPAAVP